MPRATRNWPNMYFGRPGSLVTIPYPRDEIDKPYERQAFDFLTASGEHQVSTLLGGSRSYALSWRALHTDTYGLLERYWTGNAGPGPFVLIDPSSKNLLLPNQAAATSVFNDNRHWQTMTGAANEGEILSNSAGGTTQRSVTNSRSLRWFFSSAAATTPTLTVTNPYRNWYGLPVMPGLSYVWSTWGRPDGTVDSAITMRLTIWWLNAAGTWIGETTSGDVSMTGWTRLSAIGTAPAGAVYAKPVFVVTGSTVTTGSSVYIDEPQFEQDTVVNDWAPGTGLRAVQILSLNDFVPFDARFRRGITMTLRELAP